MRRSKNRTGAFPVLLIGYNSSTMSFIQRWRSTAFFTLWALYIALTPPGLPPCWLQADPCREHIHFSAAHARSPHSHDYLFDQTSSEPVPLQAVVLLPASVLLAVLFNVQIFLPFVESGPFSRGWQQPVEPPPPKRFAHI